MRRIRVILLCWGLSISGGGVASGAAQETISYASLAGRVSDPQGGVVPGAIIVVRHLDTNAGAEAASDDDGRFRFPYLRIGPYEIIVRKPGFADVRRRLTLDAGAAYDLPVALDV
ncbi:MAG: carboxypeptidase-like regulatory domain-containing protein, partial [Phycisphaerae bacterium]